MPGHGLPYLDVGKLQSAWDGFYDERDAIAFTEKKVAYFGAGDQIGYADNFQDAIGILEEKIACLGDNSKAIRDGKFVGLAIDEDNQSDLSDSHIKGWVGQLKREFGV